MNKKIINSLIANYIRVLDHDSEFASTFKGIESMLCSVLESNNLTLSKVLKKYPLEVEDYKILIRNNVRDKILDELSYPTERICFLYGRYFRKRDYNELRIYELVNADELRDLFGQDVVTSSLNFCSFNIDYELIKEKLAWHAKNKIMRLVGELHTHKIEQGHFKGPTLSDVGRQPLGLIGFVAYLDGKLRIIPYRRKDTQIYESKQREEYYAKKESLIEFF